MILQVQAILISTGQCRDSLPPSLLCLPDPSLFLHLIRFFTTVKTLLESVSPGSMSYLPGGGGVKLSLALCCGRQPACFCSCVCDTLKLPVAYALLDYKPLEGRNSVIVI